MDPARRVARHGRRAISHVEIGNVEEEETAELLLGFGMEQAGRREESSTASTPAFSGEATGRPLLALTGESQRPFLRGDPLCSEVNRGSIAPIHVERHRGVIVHDAPLPTHSPKAHRAAVPHVLIFSALAPAHSVER